MAVCPDPERAVAPFRPGGRRARPTRPPRRRARRLRVRDRHDPKRIRYGCFLPDLTGLATAPPTPAPRGGYIRSPGRRHKGNAGMNGMPYSGAISTPCPILLEGLLGLEPALFGDFHDLETLVGQTILGMNLAKPLVQHG